MRLGWDAYKARLLTSHAADSGMLPNDDRVMLELGSILERNDLCALPTLRWNPELSLVGADALFAGLARNRSVRAVSFRYCNARTMKWVLQLAQALKENKGIRVVDLGYSSVGRVGLEAVLDAGAGVRELSLVGITFTPEEVLSLSNGLPQMESLRKLDLSWCRLQPKRFRLLLTGLGSRACRVETLELAKNDLDDASVEALFHVLSRHRRIKALNLSQNEMSRIGVQAQRFLASPRSRLEVLNLDSNQLDDAAVRCLARLLRRGNRTALSSLSLLYNPFTDVGQAMLARARRVNWRLDDLLYTCLAPSSAAERALQREERRQRRLRVFGAFVAGFLDSNEAFMAFKVNYGRDGDDVIKRCVFGMYLELSDLPSS